MAVARIADDAKVAGGARVDVADYLEPAA